MLKSGCHFINGTERVRLVQRNIYKWEQLLHLGGDRGLYVGDTSSGENVARYWNSNLEWMEHRLAAVDRHYQYKYKVSTKVSMGQSMSPWALPWQ